MEKEINFKTTNEVKKFNKPRINSGEYEFKIADVKQSEDKSKNYFILEIIGQKFEGEPVSLVWSAPINEEYTQGTNVGKLLMSVGINLGNNIKASSLIGLIGKCIVNDYTKQIQGKGVMTYSIIGELIIPEEKIKEPKETDTKDSGIQEDGTI